MFPIRDTEPRYTKPTVTILLIVVNLLVFLFEASLSNRSQNLFIEHYGLIPDRFHWSAVFTSMFVHGGWMHVLGNMWFLWIFGDNVEDILGHDKYLIFYLLCGLAAAITQVFFSIDANAPMVGASGAIAGVMGAYVVKFPRARIVTLIFIIIFFTTFEVPAWVMLLYWFALQFVGGVGSLGSYANSQGGTAFFAHIGGFLAGMLLINLMGATQSYKRSRDQYW